MVQVDSINEKSDLTFLSASFDGHVFENNIVYNVGGDYYKSLLDGKGSNSEEITFDNIPQCTNTPTIQNKIEEKELADCIQRFYFKMLFRYLQSKHSERHAKNVMHAYINALYALRKMRSIKLEKSIQFTLLEI